MKLSVNSALRLKNEISQMVGQFHYTMQRDVKYVETLVDGENLNQRDYTYKNAEEGIKAFKKLLDMSKEINDVLAKFNVDNNLSSLVREKANLILIDNSLQSTIKLSKPSTTTKHEIVGDKREKIVTVNTPTLTSEYLMSLKVKNDADIRSIQEQIDLINTKEIELTFTEEDLIPYKV